MRSGVIVRKIGMSSMFTEQGVAIPLTFLQMDACQVVAHKTLPRDGYRAVVVGAGVKRSSRLSKSLKVFFSNAKVGPKMVLKEFRVSEEEFLPVGFEVTADYYNVGQYVDVSGRSIGKGFAGSMKRHNFAGLEATHGISVSHRSHGSTGQCQDPGKVFKGKKMAGHMGDKNVTIQNLRIIKLDKEKSLIIVSGSVPGKNGRYLYLRDAVKKQLLSN